MHETESPEVTAMVDACRRMRADALALETGDRIEIVAMNVYDGTYATSSCSVDAHLPSVARGLHVSLLSGPRSGRSVALLPATTVQATLFEWERRIALVFGRQYASGLVASAAGTKVPGEMSRDDLEQIRLRLSSAVGGCLDFQKVHK